MGAKVSFELMLPGGMEAIHGEANVIRHTFVGVERLDGIGLAFVTLAGDGEQRLSAFLERRPGAA